MYIPNPIRCRACLKFGHFADKCSKEPICGFCSKPVHTGTPCESFVPQCVNCKERHHSLYIKCPKLLEEKEIKTIQFKEKITYTAAKRKYRQSLPCISDKSYAEVARYNRKVGVEVGTQTCISYDSSSKVIMASSSDFSSNTDASTFISLPNPSPSLPPHPSPSIPLPLPDPQSLPLHPSVPPALPTSPIISNLPKPVAKAHNPEACKSSGLPRGNSLVKNVKKEKKKKSENRICSDEMETT